MSEKSAVMEQIDDEAMQAVLDGAQVKPIKEAHPLSEEEDNYKEDVLKFLEEIEKRDRSGIIKTPVDSQPPSAQNKYNTVAGPMNAFSDVRIQLAGSQSRLKLNNALSRKKMSALKVSVSKDLAFLTESESAEEAAHLEILKDLDFDKVIKEADRIAEIGALIETPEPNRELFGENVNEGQTSPRIDQRELDVSITADDLARQGGDDNGDDLQYKAHTYQKRLATEDSKSKVIENEDIDVSSIISSDLSAQQKILDL